MNELAAEKKRSAKQSVLVSRIQKDLSELANILQDGKQLKEAVGKICKKYNAAEAKAGPGMAKFISIKNYLDKFYI